MTHASGACAVLLSPQPAGSELTEQGAPLRSPVLPFMVGLAATSARLLTRISFYSRPAGCRLSRLSAQACSNASGYAICSQTCAGQLGVTKKK
eukprot:CAMPEP_0170408112 /NCGR_PEP_ID=MMETSP0117_2-20130122/28616_1 /TAXON_ID=400756 /ORGANISM="Durinskia baltica, Strain CSIRO CS-38" /LENGTH=92 /DNA_ID=CAMNT_0010665423 /DNA_START=390 /DNA_END=665 /DNA_ORIENTATION=+